MSFSGAGLRCFSLWADFKVVSWNKSPEKGRAVNTLHTIEFWIKVRLFVSLIGVNVLVTLFQENAFYFILNLTQESYSKEIIFSFLLDWSRSINGTDLINAGATSPGCL